MTKERLGGWKMNPKQLVKFPTRRVARSKTSVTVAIAAMCKSDGWQAIIAAEDHMITAGDVEFEQPQPKIWKQGPYAIAMLYGDTAAQAEVSLATESEIMSQGITDIGEIASRYSDNLMAYVQRSAEASVLNPLQLTTHKFLSRVRLCIPTWYPD